MWSSEYPASAWNPCLTLLVFILASISPSRLFQEAIPDCPSLNHLSFLCLCVYENQFYVSTGVFIVHLLYTSGIKHFLNAHEMFRK